MNVEQSRPVFPIGYFDYTELRKAMSEYGCFVLTGLFDSAALKRIRERADFVGRAWDYMIEHGYTKEIEDYLASVFKSGHLPETHIDVATTWADLTTGSLFDEIAIKVFGDTTRGYALRRSTLYGNQNPLPFHQDAFFIGTEPWYNFWTPLQDCGIDAPGLEVVVRSGAPVIKDIVSDKSSVLAYVEKAYGRQSYWLPKLQTGDVLVFTSMMFHRTQSSPNLTKMRYSLELRGAIKDRTLGIANVPRDWNKIQMLDYISA